MLAPWRDRRGAFSAIRAGALVLAAVPAAFMLADWRSGAFGPIPVIGFTYWSGVWATVLLLLTLAVSPARAILGLGRLIEARRILGVSALLYSLLHVVAFAMLFRWDAGELAAQMRRPTILVASGSLALLLALGLTSTDAAVARLGAERWHRLHRLNYAASGLAVAHFLLSPGVFGAQYWTAGLFLWLMAWRALRGAGRGRSAMALGLLAIGAGAAAFGLEILWLWAYQDMPPAETLPILLTFDDELSAWWVIALAGAAAAIAAALPAFRRSQAPGSRAAPM
ncbi:ferric reductase-like transmembrane domain-containing protein [Prosthecomicrobium sp. N25]|uniref:ferric reductase-like transmembrane domain-containing protein n=1 Tax=Prosthecomicrobium sp. N25 TaxID=3129254 RepID=UPI00307883AA